MCKDIMANIGQSCHKDWDINISIYAHHFYKYRMGTTQHQHILKLGGQGWTPQSPQSLNQSTTCTNFLTTSEYLEE